MQSYAVQVKQNRTNNTVRIWGGGAAVAGAGAAPSPVPLEVLESLGAGEGIPPGAGGGGVSALAPALLLTRQAGPGRAVPTQQDFKLIISITFLAVLRIRIRLIRALLASSIRIRIWNSELPIRASKNRCVRIFGSLLFYIKGSTKLRLSAFCRKHS